MEKKPYFFNNSQKLRRIISKNCTISYFSCDAYWQCVFKNHGCFLKLPKRANWEKAILSLHSEMAVHWNVEIKWPDATSLRIGELKSANCVVKMYFTTLRILDKVYCLYHLTNMLWYSLLWFKIFTLNDLVTPVVVFFREKFKISWFKNIQVHTFQ